MILDIIIVLIMALLVLRGIRRGFVYSFIQTLGWIASSLFAFFFARPLAGALAEQPFGEAIQETLFIKLSQGAGASESMLEGLPQIISGGIKAGTETAAEILSSMLAHAVLTMFCFIAIFMITGFVLKFAIRPASRRHRHVILNTGDRILGAVAGALEGAIIVMVFMGVIMVVASISGETLSTGIIDCLKNSYVTKFLYDNNLLFIVTGGFFG